MAANTLIGASLRVLGAAKATVSGSTPVNFDFGTVNDLKIPSLANYRHNDRIVVVLTATTAGTTDTVTFSVLDAPDSSGNIGTTAAAVVDGDTLVGGTGDHFAVVGVRMQLDRPWLRISAVSNGDGETDDSFVCTATVIAVPHSI